jgi:hypothetical protein
VRGEGGAWWWAELPAPRRRGIRRERCVWATGVVRRRQSGCAARLVRAGDDVFTTSLALQCACSDWRSAGGWGGTLPCGSLRGCAHAPPCPLPMPLLAPPPLVSLASAWLCMLRTAASTRSDLMRLTVSKVRCSDTWCQQCLACRRSMTSCEGGGYGLNAGDNNNTNLFTCNPGSRASRSRRSIVPFIASARQFPSMESSLKRTTLGPPTDRNSSTAISRAN